MAASIPSFDEKLESWESYQERLEHYFVALDIDDPNKKKSILINCVGPSSYERVRNLCFPSSINDKLYEELLELFSKLFTPSIVVFKERKQFYEARKKKTEKASSWHERIRRLALNCKFGPRIEQTLLDKFVMAFDGIVFDRFCEEGADLTLAKALEIAQRYETIEAVTNTGKPKKPVQKNEGPKEQDKPKQHGQNTNKEKQPDQGQKPRKIIVKHTKPANMANVAINLNMKKD